MIWSGMTQLSDYSPASLIAPPWYNASPGKKSQGSKLAVQEIDVKGQGYEPPGFFRNAYKMSAWWCLQREIRKRGN